jgi:hypothetical protein
VKTLHLTVHHDGESIHPVHEFVCEHEGIERELLLHANPTGELASLLFHVEGDPEPYRDALERAATVESFELVPAGRGCYVYVRERPRPVDEPFYEAFRMDSLVLVPPVEFRADRTMRLTVLGDPEYLDAALSAMPDGPRVDIDRVSSDPGPSRAGRLGGGDLTERQREALAVAVAVGYYEVPREGSVADVAGELGVAESTAATHLRKAEAHLVGRVVGE